MQQPRTITPGGSSTDSTACTGASAHAAVRLLSHGHRRRVLAVCLSPILLIAATCAATAALHREPPTPPTQFQTLGIHDTQSGLANERARQTASIFLTRLIGRRVEVRHTALVSAFALHQQPGLTPQWSVLCETDIGSYLLRINSKTRGVYAVNRIDEAPEYTAAAGEYTIDPSSVCGGTPATAATEVPSDEAMNAGPDCQVARLGISRKLAQQRALVYLRKMGIPPDTVRLMPAALNPVLDTSPNAYRHTYNFAFRELRHPATIDLSVSSTDGQIETLWSEERPI